MPSLRFFISIYKSIDSKRSGVKQPVDNAFCQAFGDRVLKHGLQPQVEDGWRLARASLKRGPGASAARPLRGSRFLQLLRDSQQSDSLRWEPCPLCDRFLPVVRSSDPGR